MKNLSISAVALAIGLAFSTGAMAQTKISQATGNVSEAPADAQMKAKEASTDVRKDAAEEKRDADYKVAKEKCDAFTGDVKDRCMTEAKARFGKS